MGSADSASAQSPYLWKFISLASGQSPSWQKKLTQLLIEGRAWFASPEDFNDPFDCVPIAAVPESSEAIKAARHILINRMIASIGDTYDPSEIRDRMNHSMDTADPRDLLMTINRSIRSTASEMGVFCLSESLHETLMWSHYALNHKGIAIGFRVNSPPRGISPLIRVRYQTNRPIVDAFFSEDFTTDLMDALVTKADFWSYEHEWRAIKPGMARSYVNFDSDSIDTIAFGAKCSSEDEAEVRKLLAPKDIRFIRGVGDYDTFRLRFFSC